MSGGADPMAAPSVEASERRRLVLSGFMATGKSTVGRRLAELAGARLYDLDSIIEARAGRRIPDIFATVGEGTFREMERCALAEILAHPSPTQPPLTEPTSTTPAVVALGGGTLVDEGSRALACRRAYVVTLIASPATIIARCRGSDRPLLAAPADSQTPSLADRIGRLLAERQEAYEAGHLHVRTDSASPEAVARQILETWRGGRARAATR